MRIQAPPAESDAGELFRQQWEALSLPGADHLVAALSIRRLRQAVVARCDRGLEPFEINNSMYLILAILATSQDGASRLSDLGRQLAVHPTTVTLLIDQLENRRLVRRRPDVRDRRASRATLTPAGRAVMQEATRALAEIGFGLGTVSAQIARQLTESMRTAS